MNRTYKSVSFDNFRMIAALMVVAIHTSPFIYLSESVDFIFVHIISRLAVPLFVIITGYFTHLDSNDDLIKFLKKYSKIYIISMILYLPINIYSNNLIYKEGKTLINTIKILLFDGTFYHLWYFPAMMIGVLIIYFLRKRSSLKSSFIISLILYLIGLFGDSYYGLISNSTVINIYDYIFNISSYTRNGVFYIPIFLIMGNIIRQGEDNKIPKKYLNCFFISLVLMIMEGLILYKIQIQRHSSMYFFLLPCMFFLFKFLIQYKENTNVRIRNVAFITYIIHPFIIIIVRGMSKLINATSTLVDNSIVHYIAVCSLSIMVSFVLYDIVRHNRKREMFHKGRAWVEIDLNSLKFNIDKIKELLPENCEFMAAVKADAYGHGAIKISKELNKLGVDSFCVASILEGVNLRKSGVKGEILILGYTHPNQLYLLKRYNLIQTVIDYKYAKELSRYKEKLTVHIKINSGMQRLGEDCENIEDILDIFKFENLNIEGIYTHLCVSDSQKTKNKEFTNSQIEKFYSIISAIEKEGIECPKVHIQSSYGVLNYSFLKCNYTRIGIALYGVFSEKGDIKKYNIKLKPILSVKARVSMTRNLLSGESVGYGLNYTSKNDMKIAVVSIGYADGMPRSLSDGVGYVVIKDKKARIIGRVCMDQMLVDVTNIPDVKSGDIAIIIGEDRNEKITAMDMAEQTNTITNEILSRLGNRLEYIYIQDK